MSSEVLQVEIERFLAASEPEVLCIRGKWGVGKTYAWNQYLKTGATNKISMDRYAYVSLFGLNSLDEVRYALFESTIDLSDLADGPNAKSLARAYAWVRKNCRKLPSVAGKIPKIREFVDSSARALFFLVRNQIVCLDDLERAGEGLSVKDLLGMALYLKEQRRCKVVLLLNDEEMEEETKKHFDKQLEKVADIRFRFSPTPQEASDIVFPPIDDKSRNLRQNCIALGITNVRILKRIEAICARFENILGPGHLATPQIEHSVPLFVWSVLQPTIAPDVNLLRDSFRVQGLTKDSDSITDAERFWHELLRGYGYSGIDEFDAIVLESIENGHFDERRILAAAQLKQEQIGQSAAYDSFGAAWRLFHESFEDNEAAVADCMENAALQNARLISRSDLNATVTMLKQLGRVEAARRLIGNYVDVHTNEREVFDLQHYVFAHDIKDPDIIQAFQEKLESFNDIRDPADVLAKIAKENTYSPGEFDLIFHLTADDFYKLFKEARGERLHQIIGVALQFGSFLNATPEMKAIATNATAALQRIGKESKINYLRVAARGIKSGSSD